MLSLGTSDLGADSLFPLGTAWAMFSAAPGKSGTTGALTGANTAAALGDEATGKSGATDALTGADAEEALVAAFGPFCARSGMTGPNKSMPINNPMEMNVNPFTLFRDRALE